MTTADWVLVGMTGINVAMFVATNRNNRDVSYYTAWSEVFNAMRAHAKAAPKDDIDAISRVYAALGDAFDRRMKEGTK